MIATRELKWDTVFSTYYWNINLNPLHEKNKVTKMSGYSSAEGHAEAMDKHRLLKTKIIMLMRNGYLERCKDIEFYHTRGALINKSDATLILILKPNDYSIQPEYPYDTRDLNIYLKKIYNDALEGKKVEYLTKPSKPDYSKTLDSKLDHTQYEFKKMMDLTLHCESLRGQGFAEGHIKAFYRSSVLKMERGLNGKY